MSYYDGLQEISLLPGQSAFLWGPRQTGKSTLLRKLFPKSAYFDFLYRELVQMLNVQTSLIKELVEALNPEQKKHPIIINEVQKVPGV
jgi:uncharacterized protein